MVTRSHTVLWRVSMVGAILLTALVGGSAVQAENSATTHGAASQNAPTGYEPEACGGIVDPPSHPPIVIKSDSAFTPENGVTRGSGSTDDPFVISCWLISV